MRERNWTDAALTEALVLPGLTVTPDPVVEAALISGDLNAARADMGGAAEVGLGGATGTTPALIRIARDRALAIGADLAPGWHDAGFAVSVATGLYTGLRLSGPAARHVLAQGTSVDLDTTTSPSAALRFAGETILLTRDGGDWVIWVETPRQTALTTWLRGADLGG